MIFTCNQCEVENNTLTMLFSIVIEGLAQLLWIKMLFSGHPMNEFFFFLN